MVNINTTGSNINEDDFQRLITFVKAGYGIDLAGKQFIVQSRLANYLSDCGFADFSEYLEVVFSDTSGREAANLINRLTTNHTYFMRESEHFDHFEKVFLPQMEKWCVTMTCVSGRQGVHLATNRIISPCALMIISGSGSTAGI